MTELDEEMLPLASELIDEYGGDILFGRIEPGEYDTATGTAEPLGALQPLKALIGSGKTRTRSGGLVEGAELALTIAGERLSVEPTPEDKASVNGKVYKVLASEPTYSGQAVAIYTVWIGK